MNRVEALEFELRGGARHREALRHRRTLGQDSRKLRLHPDRRKVDPAVMKAIGIHQSRDQAKRQIVAVHRVSGKQRPAGLELDGPETVEFQRGPPAASEGRIRQLGLDMKAQGCSWLSRCRGVWN